MPEIYGTLGPACAQTDILCRMFEAGMTGMRLNLSHSSLREAEEEIRSLHRAAEKCGVKAELLIDMQGPELRIGALASPVALSEGEILPLGRNGIPVPAMVLSCFFSGQQVLLDDGKILLEIVSAQADSARARVLRGGQLTGRKSIALPGSSLHPPAMTKEDLENYAVASAYGVTGVMQPFVRDRQDLESVRRALDHAGCRELRLFAKIENREGLDHLAELLPACDQIVIARGDLGNAMPLWELPCVQKEISARCRSAGRPFMVVTQMLASMEHCAVPTRAEVSDIFNAVCDGAASVMLTGETATGLYPVESILYLARTASMAEEYCRLH